MRIPDLPGQPGIRLYLSGIERADKTDNARLVGSRACRRRGRGRPARIPENFRRAGYGLTIASHYHNALRPGLGLAIYHRIVHHCRGNQRETVFGHTCEYRP